MLYTDAYSAYESLACEFSDRLQWGCCLAHARRKFDEIEHTGPNAKARYVLSLMRKLYDIEDRAKTMSVSERQALRDRESRPLWDELRAWLDQKMITELPKSRLRGAMEYLLNRWGAFVLYLDDGAIPIDNNRCEAVFKDPILGRKNWLFLGNEDSGMTSAIMYTLTSTCKRLCMDPYAYLLDVFERIPSASAVELRNLLPDRPADWAWTGGLIDALLPSWYYGKPILAYEGGKFDPEKTCYLLDKYQVRNGFVPPTALKMLRQAEGIDTHYDINFRSIMSAGEALGAGRFWASKSMKCGGKPSLTILPAVPLHSWSPAPAAWARPTRDIVLKSSMILVRF